MEINYKKRKIFNIFSVLLLSLLLLTSCVNSSSNDQNRDDKKDDDTSIECTHEYEKKVIKEGDCKNKELDLNTCKKM